ncbi:hypothetical protein [Evtepia gabavorous]|uniref:hypothetical protein n=1 Tax=Evtepia gabavorous TaxID=2211183 RepID=UPI00399A9C25
MKKFYSDVVILDTTGFSKELKQSFLGDCKTIVEDGGVILTSEGIIKVNKTSSNED